MQELNQSEQFHDDSHDRDLVIKYVLPNIIKDYVEAFPVRYVYYPIDIYALTSKNIRAIPVQVKSRPTYSITSFPTTAIDRTAYDHLKSYGLLVILYPKDRKILVYNDREMKKAYVTTKPYNNVKSHSQKTNSWYYEQSKELTELDINKGRLFTYEQFGIYE